MFLDEIGNLPLHLQAKLLTVLEQRQVTPLGSNQIVPIDVRVVAATNVDKQKLNDECHFRQDLLFRLNTVEIPLPALRDRPQDIASIAEFYIEQYGKKYNKPHLTLTKEANLAINIVGQAMLELYVMLLSEPWFCVSKTSLPPTLSS